MERLWEQTKNKKPMGKKEITLSIIGAGASGGIRVDFHSNQVYDRKGDLRPRMYALGEITRGVHFFTNGVVPIMYSADRITDHILNMHF